MKLIDNFSELKEGHKYNLYSKQFEGNNVAVLISKDFTGLERDIVYFQYIKHIKNPISKKKFIRNIKNNITTIGTFVMWKHQFDDYKIYEL